jgi:aspartyl-tRNA(Asn)/glutamyl-tRNA(Gln) amidotransferase subunit B
MRAVYKASEPDEFELTIGLEIHAELSTASKVFCSCKVDFAAEPNSNICPVCTGQPGALPRLNKLAVEYAVRAGIAFGCKINWYSRFDRKNYFYADTPKSYQISQSDFPLCTRGEVVIGNGAAIRINRIHLEEDAGKMTHDPYSGKSLIDFNRSGVGLIEIVTEPDIKSAKDAVDFISKVALYLRYLGVSNAKMEEGNLRADVNVSVKRAGAEKLGQRAEIKNMNSLRAIEQAINFEFSRQTQIIREGGAVIQETRKFNENTGETEVLRRKENANDYRYFPEPDLPSIMISEEYAEIIKSQLPLMPDERFYIYTEEQGLSAEDARILLLYKYISDFYDDVVRIYPEYRRVANFLVTEALRRVRELNVSSIPFSADYFAKLIKMFDSGLINRGDVKEIIRLMFLTGADPEELARAHNLIIERTDDDLARRTIERIINENPDLIDKLKAGKTNVKGFLMGRAMTELKGKASTQEIKDCLDAALEGRKTTL